MADIRTTQEIFGDLFGGLVELGTQGFYGFVIANAVVELLVEKGIITKEEIGDKVRKLATEAVSNGDETDLVTQAYHEVLERMNRNRDQAE